MDLISYVEHMWDLVLDHEKQGYFFFGAVYLFIVCTYSIIYQIRISRWPHTAGDLIDIGTNLSSGGTHKSDYMYSSRSTYTYTVDGQTYEGYRVSPGVISASYNARKALAAQMKFLQFTPEGNVLVFYNPANPQKSFLIPTGPKSIAFTLLIADLPLIAYFLTYHL